ncbi:SHOCT domain-containing protein [Alkaliphilus sp. B6464]|uniref:SHOCT domain-containing protein n=1 Tax=Alkaliphilus sp. B6464 TaxID=2731219 RepID=UPI001BA888F4|nr:SHOCT domain-containing protein [Alkaliphilus sp. B6464]QUH20255.1 SHOCT domain-containing protein [Alkaliphilus sp. B6464]
MGLFGKKEMCSICNNHEGKNKLSGHVACNHCFANGRYFLSPVEIMNSKNLELSVMIDAVNKATRSEELSNVFSTTQQIADNFYIDENNRLWAVIVDTFNEKKRIVFKFEDVAAFELLQDGETITKGGIGSVVTGSLIARDMGAIIGGLIGSKQTKKVIQKFEIRVDLKDSFKPFYINLLKGVGWGTSIKSDSLPYKTACKDAENILSALSRLTDLGGSVEESSVTSTSLSDEIIKLKALFDEGILTEEEFNAAKARLLQQ